MMKCLKDKLKAKSGASLAATLLLFLVCAVIGSAVLTAASATSGRIAERRESDRRYYAVTSAAKLFADEISSYTVVVEETATITETDTGDVEDTAKFEFGGMKIKTIDESKEPIQTVIQVNTINNITDRTKFSYNETADNNQSLLEDIVLTMFAVPKAYELTENGTDTEGNMLSAEAKIDLWKNTYKNGATYEVYPTSGTKDFQIIPKDNTGATIKVGEIDMIVYGRVSGTQSGEIEAIFSNEPLSAASGSIPKDAYYVTVTCTPQIDANIRTTDGEEESTSYDEEKGTTTKKTPQTKEIKINYITTLKESR